MLNFLPWGIECNVRACGKKGGGGKYIFMGVKFMSIKPQVHNKPTKNRDLCTIINNPLHLVS